MRRAFCTGPIILLAWLAGAGHAETPTDDAVQRQLSEAYATTILLADGEAIQLGLVNFNPNDVARLDNENFGTEESVTGREKLSLFSLPLELEVPAFSGEHDLQGGLRFSVLREVERGKLATSLQTEEDRFETRVYSAESLIRWRYRFAKSWRLDLGQALHLMRYENRTDFRNGDSRDRREGLDGRVTNYSNHAFVSRTTTGIVWLPKQSNGRSEYFSSLNYLAGDALHPDISEHNAEPEAWYWRNGVRAKLPVLAGSSTAKHVLLKLNRVNVGGDLRDPMGSAVYYEAGIGFVSGLEQDIPFLRNLGLFLNLNYGSDLRGGTLGLLYNVD